MMNFFIVPGNTRMDVSKKELESLLEDKKELKEGDFVFFHNKMRNALRYFPWKILWAEADTITTGYFPWWPDSGSIHKATQYEYDNLIKTLPSAFIN
jgi:hypothetical protein